MRLKALQKKKLVKAKKIITDLVMYQLVPQVSSLKTPKMFDSLTKLFEGKNINRNMTLRNRLKNVKIQNAEQLEAGECRSGDSHLEWPPRIMVFIHARNVCQKEVITFSRLWEEHTQEDEELNS